MNYENQLKTYSILPKYSLNGEAWAPKEVKEKLKTTNLLTGEKRDKVK